MRKHGNRQGWAGKIIKELIQPGRDPGHGRKPQKGFKQESYGVLEQISLMTMLRIDQKGKFRSHQYQFCSKPPRSVKLYTYSATPKWGIPFPSQSSVFYA